MTTTADYLNQLKLDKQTLVSNLVAKGVEATNDETFTSLVVKVLDITTKSKNLLKLLETNAEYQSYDGSEGSITWNADNTISILANGTGSWGVDIKQNDLTLEVGKTYRFSCDNIESSTWVSLDNENNMMLSSSTSYVDITPTQNTTISKIVIWFSDSAVYNNIVWNLELKEI